jgi:hypothetical protein
MNDKYLPITARPGAYPDCRHLERRRHSLRHLAGHAFKNHGHRTGGLERKRVG